MAKDDLWVDLLALLYLYVLSSCVLAIGFEWEHYRRLIALHWMRATRRDRAVVLGMLVAKSLWLFLPSIVCFHVLRWIGLSTTAWFLGIAYAAALLAWLLVDLRVQRATGNHLWVYARFITHPKVMSYAGGASGLAWRVALVLLACVAWSAISARGCLWMAGCWTRWLGGGPVAWGLTIGVVSAWTLSSTVTSMALGNRMILERFLAAIPTPLPWARGRSGHARGRDAPLETLNRDLLSGFRELQSRLVSAQPADERRLPGDAAALPNILLLTLESLRHDAISPDVMPKLHARTRQGMRFERHYAGTNASQFGLFSLLYGRSALAYHATLDGGVPPQACVTLRNSGYWTGYFSSAGPRWQRMEEFLNVRAFDKLHIQTENDWPTDDRLLLESLTTAAAERTREQPRFLVAFLMSTHYPYRYPADHARFLPAVPVHQLTQATRRDRDQVLNRYRNAASFMDELLDEFLANLDLKRNLVIVTGDHGESIFEDGFIAHYSRLSEMQTRVPLVMFGGGAPTLSVTSATTHADVLPTLLHLLAGQPHMPRHCHGHDLLDESTIERPTLLASKKGNRPWDALMLWRERRMRIEMCMSPATIRAMGLADEQCDLDPNQPLSRKDAGEWCRIIQGELRRLAA